MRSRFTDGIDIKRRAPARSALFQSWTAVTTLVGAALLVGCGGNVGSTTQCPASEPECPDYVAPSADAGLAADGGAPDAGFIPDAGSGGGSLPFTPLHTYYISPTGLDSNDGTSGSPWKTPNHAVNCGDVIIAAAGTYGGSSSPFGTNNRGLVSNCPSTSGGTDGSGGIYFAILLCAGPELRSCSVTNSGGEAFRVDESNWAVEGFSATSGAQACFTATSESSATLHHIAFINNVASGCQNAGFDSYSWQSSGGGVDQTAVVGAIAFNGAQTSSLCGSGVSLIPNDGPDSSPGTHIFAAGMFSYANVNGANCAGGGNAGSGTTDGEGYILDSWACGQFTHQGALEQSVFWSNGSAGLEIFPNCTMTNDQSDVYVTGVTSFGNYQDPSHTGAANGELLFNDLTPSSSAIKSVTNSIFEATQATPGGAIQTVNYGYPVYGFQAGTNNASTAFTIVSENFIWNAHAPTTTTFGGSNTNVYLGGSLDTSSFPFGTNTYDTPGFANPAALPTTAPNCLGQTNTTACMAAAGVIADLTPSGGAAEAGYQPPTTCAADPYYPTWLKGVVYLAVSSSSIVETHGLITKPCGM